MRRFAMLSAVVALGSFSLALAVPTPAPQPPKAPVISEHLAPKMVKLNLNNVSVVEAIAELSRQSGYAIQIDGDQTPLANRKITLVTGEVTFFQAFDQLCVKGGLIERNASGPIIRPLPVQPLPPNIRPNLKIQPVPPAPPAPQVQVKPIQVQPGIQIQLQPAVQRQPIRPVRFNRNTFVVADGKPLVAPTAYVGALRVRVLPESNFNVANQPGETTVVFEVTAEPRLLNFNVVGSPEIKKAMDDLGQTLVAVNPNVPGVIQPGFKLAPPQPNVQPLPPRQGNAQPRIQPVQPAIAQPAIAQPMIARVNFGLQRIVTVRLKLGEKKARTIQELTGTINVQVPTTESIAIDNVLQAKGKKAGSKNKDISVILESIDKMNDGYQVRVTVEQQLNVPNNPVPLNPLPNPAPPGRLGGGVQAPNVAPAQVQAQARIQVQIQPGAQVQPAPVPVPFAVQQPAFFNTGLPNLVDAQGNAYQIVSIGSNAVNANGVLRRTYTLQYRAAAGQGEPARMVLNQSRMVIVPVAFSFENVPVR